MEPSKWTLTARWILPVSGPPLERGTVTVAGDTIIAVEPHGSRAADLDLGNVAVIPGLVNAHTHLDLSSVSGRIPFNGDFTNWLRGVIAYRRSMTTEQVEIAVRAGLAESLSHGVTLLGDISGDGSSWDVLAAAPLRAVVFRELIGLPSDRARAAWMGLLRWRLAERQTLSCRAGVSPHAPYSVNASIIRAAAWNGFPLSIHLAETAAELELLERHTGPFVPFLKEVGAWYPESLAPSLDWVLWRTDWSPCVLYVHCNFLPADSVIPPQGTVVYCPRTHAYFSHPPHPFRDFLKRGVRVALGTDSRASNPDLDLFAEARFLHQQYPDFPCSTLLWMATLAGAEALGWADVTGSLAPGKSADLVALPLPDRDDADPYQLLFEADLPGRRVLWRGEWRETATRQGTTS